MVNKAKKKKVEDVIEEVKVDSVTTEAKIKEPLTVEEEDYKTQMQRVQAEFDNYRRRTNAEKGELRNFYTSNVLVKFLPILDHFNLALMHECSDKNYSMGIEMIFNQFKEMLNGEGIKEIDILNKTFDPKLAEAVGTEYNKKFKEEIVLDLKSAGYILGDKVIRRAKVIVNKKN